jgi:hypothetical protein
MGHPLGTRHPMGGGCGGNLRPVVGDGYGWLGVLPIVGVGMGRSYPMCMYSLPSLNGTGKPSTLMRRLGI